MEKEIFNLKVKLWTAIICFIIMFFIVFFQFRSIEVRLQPLVYQKRDADFKRLSDSSMQSLQGVDTTLQKK
jgi:hypothetical protein